MSKIDVSRWKEFKIDELFDKCILHKRKKIRREFDLSVKKTLEFDLPVVNAKHDNNGIMYYGRRSDFEIANKVIDIVQDGASSVGDVYPQFDDVSVLFNAYLIKLKNHVPTENQLAYLSTVLQRAIKLYFSYDNKCTWDKLKRLFIKLPVTSSGEPDWQYMDSYIAKRAALAHKYVSELAKAKDKPKPLKINGWKEFKLSSMFDVTTSKSVDRRYLDFVDDSDAVNFVGRGMLNNGIQGRILPEHVSFKPNSAYTMSLSQIGNNWATWHDTLWFASQNVFVLTPISEKLAGRKARYFIQSVINRNLIMYYNRGYEKYPKQSDIRDMMLTLPVDSSGNPDWKYMNDYVEFMKSIADRHVDYFQSIINK